MNKCIGCGAILQDSNELELGYVKNISSPLCERCFKIQNYGNYMPVIKDETEFINMLKEINNTNDLVVLVVDLFNFNPNMELINKYISNDVILVLTKRDILPKSLYEEKLLNYIDTNLNIVDKIIISSKNNYHFDELMSLIKKDKKTNNVYVIGYTNVGKSTMINKILYNYGNKDSVITTSLLPNTTIDNININIDDELTLIDTPGILDNGSIYYLKDIKELKKIIPKKEIKPVSYQIRKKQTIMVKDLFELTLSKNDIVLYISNALKIDRIYKDNIHNMVEHKISVKQCEDIVISGVGFIKFMYDEDITLYTLDNLNVYVRKSLI